MCFVFMMKRAILRHLNLCSFVLRQEVWQDLESFLKNLGPTVLIIKPHLALCHG